MTRRSYGARPGGILSVSNPSNFTVRTVVEGKSFFIQDCHNWVMIALTADLPHNLAAKGSALAKMSFGLHAR